VCPALLVSIGVLLGAVQATAEDCPTGTPSPVTHRVAIAPEAPRFGSRVDVSIQLKAGEQLDVKAICFDSHPGVPAAAAIHPAYRRQPDLREDEHRHEGRRDGGDRHAPVSEPHTNLS
jgi:hypothetical protein